MGKLQAILADDEAVIVRGLKKLIDWEKLGIEIVGEAKDGEEALALIREKRPQLAISDIAMPGLNGLEMLRKIGEENLNTKVIFVSGYQEFSYAKDAVRYGAVDYLLKPVEREELQTAVLKAVSQIDDQNRLDILEPSEKDDQIHQLFQKIGGENCAIEELYEQFSNLNISVEGKRMTGVAFRLYTLKKSEKNARMQELLKFATSNKIQKKLENSGWGFIIKKDVSTCYAIMLTDRDQERGVLERRLRALIDEATDRESLTVKVGVGAGVEDAGNLPLAYKTARFALELYYFTEEAMTWYDDVQKDFVVSFEEYQECFQRLEQNFLGHEKDMNVEVGRLLSVIKSLHFGNRFAALNRCNMMLSELTQCLCEHYMLDQNWIKEADACMEQMRLTPTYRQTCEVLISFLDRMKEEIRLGGSGEHNETVRIRRYIEEHFRENLTLESMAQVIGMNPYYFSSYFKKNLGENFKTYLTEIRMQEAVRLLMHTDYKAYEIAEAVGYRNVRQFNENFRGKYGKSPNEYRKEQRSE
ncbi:response regulator transcription factor [Brotaphodocola sp.]|uniref:response regulator transcription factor n=1 Tax=Brotaphodocola sp. TaxID=3073577 RepID=UPI003D7EE8F2